MYLFIDDILHNSNNRISQIPLRFHVTTLYIAFCTDVFPILILMFLYFKLVRYVHRMHERVACATTLSRAQHELRMVGRTLLLVTILLVVGVPYLYLHEINRHLLTDIRERRSGRFHSLPLDECVISVEQKH